MGFVSLHSHSSHSFLDGYSSVDSHCARAAANGQNAFGLTDHQEVSGHIKLHDAAKKHGIRPVYGMEGYWHPFARTAQERKLTSSDYSHITLLAKNNEGLKNLWRWSTRAYVDRFYYRGIVDWQDMRELSAGIFGSDGCLLGHMAQAIIADDEAKIHELMGQFLETFDDRFFMELHTWQFLEPQTADEHNLNAQMTKVNQRKVELAQTYGVPLVVVNDCHYASPEEWLKHAYVWRMNTKANSDQTPPGRKADWLMEEHEIVHFMELHGISERITREAIDTSQWIADQCDAELPIDDKRIDRIPTRYGDPEIELRELNRILEDGFKRKVIDKGKPEEPYRRQLEHEMQTLTGKGFVPYFNVVADIIDWAKNDAKMFVGPGRGSAGGSLVGYLSGITEVDPLDYGLLFERFVNPDRNDWPDIDSDFPQSRLQEVKDRIAGVYGPDHVCQVGTVQESKPKSMIKDLCRAMGIGFTESNAITKLFEKTKPDDNWEQALEKAAQVKPASGKDLEQWMRDLPDLFKEAQEMLGMVRQAGTHPSAFLVSSEPLDGLLPMRVSGQKNNRRVVCQFDGTEVERLGFMKIDLLGIRNNDTIAECLRMIEKRHGRKIDLYDFSANEYADPAIWKGIAAGDNLGIFQIDADSMGETAAKLKPESEREVAELLAINRPGVINAGLLEPYIRRKHGREEVSFDHPMMEEITGETYGIMIYQEQLMTASKVIAGFTGGEAEGLRKVVGKKQIEKLPALREQFYAGAHANTEFIRQCKGDPEAVIDKIWTSIEKSGEYLFNKSHSVEYALTAAWQTWLRHYYYPEYITALMITDSENIAKHVRHARRNGLEILPPDINESDEHFTLTDAGIRYGLTDIRSLGDTAFKEIARTRPYTSLGDMLNLTSKTKVNKTVVLNLIRIGALDSLDPDRLKLEQQYYDYMSIKPKDRTEPPAYGDVLEMYRFEKHILGNFLVNDPIRQYEPIIDQACVQEPDQLDELRPGDTAKVGGMITRIKRHTTRNGDPMAFMQISYHERDFDVVVFPEAWREYKPFIADDAPIVARVIRTKKGVHLSTLVRLDMM